MPYKAIHDGEVVGPHDVTPADELWCPECGDEPWELVRRHERSDSDEPVGRYFRPKPDRTGTDGASCGHDGESDRHLQMCSLARSALKRLFGDALAFTAREEKIDAPVSDKEYRKVDALGIFSERHPLFGRGVAIEAQYKNKSKDIPMTTRDYVAQDIAAVWTWTDDYGDRNCRLDAVDVRHRARDAATDHALGDRLPSNRALPELVEPPTGDSDRPTSGATVEATVPAEFFQNLRRHVWGESEWSVRFRPPEYSDTSEIESESHVPASIHMRDWLSQRRPLYHPAWGPCEERALTKTERSRADLKVPLFLESGLKRVAHLLTALERKEGVEPPPTPFEDVQCYWCGSYWHWQTRHTHCPSCGAEVSLEWNRQNHRISANTYRELRDSMVSEQTNQQRTAGESDD